jgi:hypothetical protein
VTAAYSRTPGETVAGSPYTISAVLSPAGVLGNYTITYNTANFTITPKAASVTPDAKTKIYGDADPVLTGTLSGFLAGDSVTAAYSRTPGETVAGSPYTISAVLSPAGVLGNYTITYNTANFTIMPKALTVTANNRTKTYGATVTFAGTEFASSGLVNADTVTSVTLTSAGSASSAAAGTYSIVPSAAVGTGLGNYTISYVSGSLTANKASIGLSASSSVSTSTHGHEVTFTATVTGTGATGTVTFKDGETILDSSTLSNGTATYTTSTLSAGTHSITAVYGGDANFADSTSSDVPLTVKAASGVNWGLIAGIITAVVLVGLLLFLLFGRRKKKTYWEVMTRNSHS